MAASRDAGLQAAQTLHRCRHSRSALTMLTKHSFRGHAAPGCGCIPVKVHLQKQVASNTQAVTRPPPNDLQTRVILFPMLDLLFGAGREPRTSRALSRRPAAGLCPGILGLIPYNSALLPLLFIDQMSREMLIGDDDIRFPCLVSNSNKDHFKNDVCVAAG